MAQDFGNQVKPAPLSSNVLSSRTNNKLLSWAKEVSAGRAMDAVRTIVAVPSAALRAAGFYRPVTLDIEHARHIMNVHPEITPEILAALPDVLQRPRAVVKTGNSFTITVDVRVDGKPVVVAVRQETLADGSKKLKVTGVATAFPQEESAAVLARALLDGDAIYAPEKEIARLRQLLALQPTGSIPVNPAEAGTAPQESNKDVRDLQPVKASQNSERVVTIKTENGEVKFSIPENAPQLLSGVMFSKAAAATAASNIVEGLKTNSGDAWAKLKPHLLSLQQMVDQYGDKIESLRIYARTVGAMEQLQQQIVMEAHPIIVKWQALDTPVRGVGLITFLTGAASRSSEFVGSGRCGLSSSP